MKDIYKLGIALIPVNIIFFIIVEIFFAQTIVLALENKENTSGRLVSIIMIGFFISMIISGFSAYLITEEYDRNRVIIIILISLALNIIMWIIIVIIASYNLIPTLTFTERFMFIGDNFVLFSVVYLPNATLLWIFSGISYVIIFTLLMDYFNIKIRKDSIVGRSSFL